ncbi:MAG: hypothetical protein HYZ53_28830 [Planctomycetes bacterium]|nr:hypothetical protein [Planctomycetota bacterium]
MSAPHRRRTQGTPCAVGLLLAALVLAFAARAAPAQDGSELRLEAEAGLGGTVPCWGWTPIWVRVTNRGPGVRGTLFVEPQGPVPKGERVERRVDLPQGATKEFWLYAFPSLPECSFRVGLEVAGEGEVRELLLPGRGADWGITMGLLGDAGLSVDELESVRPSRVRVGKVLPSRAPDRWVGYTALQGMVVAQASTASLPTPEQGEAFVRWVRCGGLAIIVASRGAAPVRGTPFGDLLPARLGPMRDLDAVPAITAFALEEGDAVPTPAVVGASSSRITVSTVGECRGTVLLEKDGVPLIVAGHCGLGRVVLLTFDPWSPPFARWPGMSAIWHRLLFDQPILDPSPRIDVVGGDPERMRDLAALSPAGVRLRCVAPADLPADASGYDDTDWLVVTRASRHVFARPEQEQAVRTWASHGGQVLAVCAEGGAVLRGSAIDRWLVGRLGNDTVEVSSVEGLEWDVGAAPSCSPPFRASKLTTTSGISWWGAAGQAPLVFQEAYDGPSQAVFLTFDPWSAPFAGWPPMRRFWRRAYHLGDVWFLKTNRAFQSPESELLRAQPRRDRLALLFVAYLLVQGPADWWLLRRLRWARWRWATAALWGVLFGGAAFALGVEGRIYGPRLWQSVVVNLDGEGLGMAAEARGGLYSSWGGRYTLTASTPETFLHEYGIYRSGVGSSAEPVMGTVTEQAEVCRLRSLHLLAGEHRDFTVKGEWPAGTGPSIRVVTTSDGVRVSNGSGFALEEVAVFSGGSLWTGMGRVAAGEDRALPWAGAASHGLLRRGWTWKPIGLPGSSDSVPQVLRRTLVTNCLLTGHGLGEFGTWLASGGKILVARVDWNPCRVRVEGSDPERIEATLLRVSFR